MFKEMWGGIESRPVKEFWNASSVVDAIPAATFGSVDEVQSTDIGAGLVVGVRGVVDAFAFGWRYDNAARVVRDHAAGIITRIDDLFLGIDIPLKGLGPIGHDLVGNDVIRRHHAEAFVLLQRRRVVVDIGRLFFINDFFFILYHQFFLDTNVTETLETLGADIAIEAIAAFGAGGFGVGGFIVRHFHGTTKKHDREHRDEKHAETFHDTLLRV